MSDTISWSFTVGAASGAGLDMAGALATEAATSATIDLEPAMGAQSSLALQLADVSKLNFLAISCTVLDGAVEVQADGAAVTKLTGPLILFGDGIKLFAGSLATLKVQNKHATEAATLSVLIGRNLDA